MYQEVARRVEKQLPRGRKWLPSLTKYFRFFLLEASSGSATLNFAHCAGAETLLPSAALE
jgi:hypothetical protein